MLDAERDEPEGIRHELARRLEAGGDEGIGAEANVRAMIELDTPRGPARAHLHPAADPAGALVLGHGAGGGVGAPDLAATEVAVGLGYTVALVEQPYRVAGRRSPAPAHQLDAAWIAVLEQLRAGPLRRCPW